MRMDMGRNSVFQGARVHGARLGRVGICVEQVNLVRLRAAGVCSVLQLYSFTVSKSPKNVSRYVFYNEHVRCFKGANCGTFWSFLARFWSLTRPFWQEKSHFCVVSARPMGCVGGMGCGFLASRPLREPGSISSFPSGDFSLFPAGRGGCRDFVFDRKVAAVAVSRTLSRIARCRK